ncbi:DMT family transporter [Pseudohoeflea coraliihabitans]|uniref:DMT family transporter n=1 Tax=Pseudohoeflea coraliihabitans TaxID=2860393 RepID=A0ABS6WNP7_9HYPH|nr:DMT family transporter [Pseudohoeflea sp. DP4N28-3]MBW3097558.1 DMT family transporter [Pseudohoeflea sp. DP4N28-3]
MRNQIFGYLLLVLLAAIWGASFLFIKVALGTVTPLTIAAGRIGLAAIVLASVARLAGHGLPPRGAHWPVIIAIALLGNVIPFSLISFGERSIDSSLAAILVSTVPLFTILLAHFLTNDEPLNLQKVIGVAIGLGGIVLLFGPALLLQLGSQAMGQLMIVGGALGYALSTIYSRRLRALPKLQSSAAIMLVASLFIVPAALIVDRPWTLAPDPAAIVSIAILGLVATALAQILVLKILETHKASFLALNNYLVPLFGLLWGMVFLAERPGPQTATALSVILVGVFISQGGASKVRAALRNGRSRRGA